MQITSVSRIIVCTVLICSISCKPTVTSRRSDDPSLLQQVKNSADRNVRMAEFQQLSLEITSLELENGQMPSREQLHQRLSRDYPALTSAIDNGDILIPEPITKSGLWAYTNNITKSGGLAIHAGTVMQMTSEIAQQLIQTP